MVYREEIWDMAYSACSDYDIISLHYLSLNQLELGTALVHKFWHYQTQAPSMKAAQMPASMLLNLVCPRLNF